MISVARFQELGTRLGARYGRFFSIQEIRDTPALQWYFGASLFVFFITFYNWISTSSVTVEDAERANSVCWPYIPDCSRFYFFHDLSTDYSRTVFYMALYAIMALIVWCMWKRSWNTGHMLLAVLFLWEALVVFALDYATATPYFYYHLFLTALLLFVPYKEYFLKTAFVLFYFLSASVKFDSTWVMGTYFTALKTGLPIFPDALIPIFTNAVILSQVVGCWFLLSRNAIRQRTALIFFAFFHLYSGIFVQYFYPSSALPPLLILFGPMYRYTPAPFSRRALAGWIAIILICLFQMLGFLASGDRRLTLEGNRFGMFMFEANHQCRIRSTMYYDKQPDAVDTTWRLEPSTKCSTLFCEVSKSTRTENDMTVVRAQYESASSLYRCDPYDWWARYRQACDNDPDIRRVALTFDHSINGGPFYRIIDTEDICALPYALFRHNEWIKTPPEAGIVGYPVQNFYHSN